MCPPRWQQWFKRLCSPESEDYVAVDRFSDSAAVKDVHKMGLSLLKLVGRKFELELGSDGRVNFSKFLAEISWWTARCPAPVPNPCPGPGPPPPWPLVLPLPPPPPLALALTPTPTPTVTLSLTLTLALSNTRAHTHTHTRARARTQ